jgi:glycine cleavage system aminomethyltransferase T
LGWEIYVPIEEGAKAWVTLFEAGQVDGLVPVGIGVYATTGRLEKGYRALGNELTADYNIVEAGMARPTVKKADFIGREAYLAQRGQAQVTQLCTLTVDDHRSKSGVARYMLGGEPIVSLEGERLVDERGRPSYVTSAGSGPSLGKHLLLAYLPNASAEVGTRLLIEYLGETYPVTVDVVGSTPLFDPDNSRVRS